MRKATLTKVNGRPALSRVVLERNAMDFLTCDEEADFNDCLDWVEGATTDQLLWLLADDEYAEKISQRMREGR